jgi:hypothetical protein
VKAKYTHYSEACLSQKAAHASHVEPETDDIIMILVSSGYVVNLTTHQFISDIGGGNIVARSGNLASKTITSGVLNAAAETLTSVSGSVIIAVILARTTGVDATSPLMTYTDEGTGLPATPSGSNITVTPDSGAFKLFEL